MLTKTKIVLVAAVLLGSASSAFAIDPDGFDVDMYRPNSTANWNAHSQRHFAGRAQQRGFVQAPASLGGGRGTAAPYSAGPQGGFDRAGASWSNL